MRKNLKANTRLACGPQDTHSPLSPVGASGVKRRRLLSTAACLGLAGVVAVPARAAGVLKVGFVYVTPVLEAGWTRQHDDGRQALVAALGARVSTQVVESVAEGADAERVIRELAAGGCGLVFTTSFGYMEPTLKVAQAFPGVRFESITGYKRSENVATANARYYEGRYLSGIAAARMSASGVAGYVAGFPIPEVIQGINAFTLGMRSVNPQARVILVWLNNWFDPPREREAALSVFAQGADVVAFHVASTAVMGAAKERGKFAIAYHSDMRRSGGDAQLLAVTHHWGDYYTSRARAVLDGSWRSTDIWGGVRQGMVRVGHFGPKVPKAIQDEVLARQVDLAEGRIAPFAARAGSMGIRDQAGAERVPAGAALGDAQILGMNWLVQGVQGVVPR